jgi:hypothetical protein
MTNTTTFIDRLLFIVGIARDDPGLGIELGVVCFADMTMANAFVANYKRLGAALGIMRNSLAVNLRSYGFTTASTVSVRNSLPQLPQPHEWRLLSHNDLFGNTTGTGPQYRSFAMRQRNPPIARTENEVQEVENEWFGEMRNDGGDL